MRAATVDFARGIQPVLEKSCYGCHGPAQQMAGLRLDSRDAVLRVVRPGKPEESPLYQRIAGLGDKPRMPMGGTPLPADQIARLRAWIEGLTAADLPRHWAYVPPRRPPLPPGSAGHPIDRFVQARLAAEGLRPAPEADRATLLRRLSLDLVGLPPTVAEIDAFLADKSRNAYEKQVARLLASPHYGEKWGRHWLDAARYADSDGYEKDKSRQVWFYRDWVIRALNRDLPYDRFLVEQIAGDLLPGATTDQIVATGFLRNSMLNEEGGIDPEQFRMEAMFDRMDAIGKSILGITIQCAQCHSHKYDPLTHEEYYRLFAFLNNAHEANIAVYTPEEQKKRDEIVRRTREIERDLQQRNPGWEKRMAAWQDEIVRRRPSWTVVRPEVEDISTGGQRYLPLDDGSLLAQGYAPTKHRVKLTLRTGLPRVAAFRLELLTDPNLPLGGPGRSIKGTGALTEFEVETAQGQKLKIARATADISLPETPLEAMFHDKTDKKRVTGPVDFAIDGKDETAWGIDVGPGLRNVPRNAVFVLDQPVTDPQGVVLNVFLSQRHGGWNSDDNQNHNLGRIRLSVTSAADAIAEPPLNFSYWRTTVPEWKDANETIAAIWREHPEGSSQLVLQERKKPRATNLLKRGDFLQPEREVTPGVPAFLHPLRSGEPLNRLGLARWLVDRNSPTTARALVNRVWQAYFGMGLVEAAEDLGRQSAPPSHPELLDWLAVEFMDKGWSWKALHRTIVTSATYRQSSKVSPELLTKDPYNRLLARGPRFRVEAETVRDIALAASGLLNPKIGGPSVYAPAPDFLFLPPASYGPKIWKEATGPDRYRRAMYTFRYRSVPYPALQAFDAPSGEVACVRRMRSNTPLQALTMLNEPLFVEAAKALGERVIRNAKTDDARVQFVFRCVLGRAPTPAEAGELLGFVAKQQARLGEGPAWTAASRVVLNLDAAITKE
jgi:hypothetical protein